ncbi:MAG: hypothetical protein WD030_05030 [Pirellulales bacterium]
MGNRTFRKAIVHPTGFVPRINIRDDSHRTGRLVSADGVMYAVTGGLCGLGVGVVPFVLMVAFN